MAKEEERQSDGTTHVTESTPLSAIVFELRARVAKLEQEVESLKRASTAP